MGHIHHFCHMVQAGSLLVYLGNKIGSFQTWQMEDIGD